MKHALRLAPLLLLASTLPCLGAGLERYKDWNKSPEFTYLATDAEQKAWKKVTTDEEADHFTQLFWAKRDPDLKTPVNEFKVVFDQRIKEADQLFAMPRLRGALTERGKLRVLLGRPRGLKRDAGIKTQPGARRAFDDSSNANTGIPSPNEPGTSIGESIVTFTYEATELPGWAAVKSLTAQFVVEASSDFVAGRSAADVKGLEVKARMAALRNPGLKEPPHSLRRWTSRSLWTSRSPSPTRRIHRRS